MDGYLIVENQSSHHEMVSSAVRKLLFSEEYSDITLTGQNGCRFFAHRFILDAYSPYLKSLSEEFSKIKNQSTAFLVFAGIPRIMLEYLLTYMYEGEVKVREEDLANFYTFANSLDVKGFENEKFRAGESQKEKNDSRGRLSADQLRANMFQLPVDNQHCPPVSVKSTSPYLQPGMITPNIFGPSVFNNLAMGGNLFPLSSTMSSPLKPPTMRSPKPASTPMRDNFPNHFMNGVPSSKSPEEILLGNASLDFSKTATGARVSPINPALHNLVSAASTLPPNFATQIQQMAQQQSLNRSSSRSPTITVPPKVEGEDEPVDVQGVEDESEEQESSLHSRSDSVNNSNNRSDQHSSSGRDTVSPKIDVEEPQKMDIASNLGLPTPFNWGSFAHPPNDSIQNLENPEQTADLIHQFLSRAQNQPPFQGLYNTLAPSMGLFNPVSVPSANMNNINQTVANLLHQTSSKGKATKTKKTAKRAGPKPKGKNGNIKPFPCPNENCIRKYASSGNLKRHLKFECKMEPMFICRFDGCGLKFQHKHSLKIHANSAHGMTIDKEGNLITIFKDPTLSCKGKNPSKTVSKTISQQLATPPKSIEELDERLEFLAKEKACTATASVALGVDVEELNATFLRLKEEQQALLNKSHISSLNDTRRNS